MQTGSPFPSKRLKRVASLRRLRVDGNEDGRPYVRLEDITPWTGNLSQDVTANLNEDATSLGNSFEPGDVLFGKLRPYLAKVWVAEFSGRCSTECLVMEPGEIESRFLGYVCVTREFIDAVDACTYGSKMPRAEWEHIGNMSIPVPEQHKQCAIIDYLDRETARLDALVQENKRVLELLVEKRQALTATVVTRGIDSAAPLMPSGGCASVARKNENRAKGSGRSDNARVATGRGVNWHERYPRRRLKYTASINDDVLGEDTKHDYELKYVDIGNVYSSGSVQDPVAYQFKDAPSRARRRVRDGDIIVSSVRTYLQAIASIQNPPENLIVSTGFVVVRPLLEFLDSRFAKYTLREPSFLAEIQKRSVGISYPAIKQSELADISIPLPPLPEQRAIADFLDKETGLLDTVASKIEDAVTLLKERRTALISAAVSGRIDMEGPA